MKRRRLGIILLAAAGIAVCAAAKPASPVETKLGKVKGAISADGKVRIFKGIPFAAPPVGNLRWQAPQPAAKWHGVRNATEFGPRCMQGRIFDDMIFRDRGPSEDCLYLNVWAPAEARAPLPVMVWIYGGGFAAGAASEPRQDGQNLAKKGVVVVSMNYRLNIFGFFVHPELAKESGHGASGNYGLLDQVAALEWVRDNIAQFQGDPANVTIFGESAGSFSVSALMASPLAKGLFKRAIGESGSLLGRTLTPKSLTESEEEGVKFAQAQGADSLAALRAKPAAELLQATLKEGSAVYFSANVDGYFLPEDPVSIYANGKQAQVSLLAGWNADEGSAQAIFGKEKATPEAFAGKVKTMFGENADKILAAYPASSGEEAKVAARDLASDQFIAFSTWKWLDMQRATGHSTIYRYEFDDSPPAKGDEPSHGAYHSAEIEFVFEDLKSKDLPWRPEDYKLSDLMSSYWTNFAKTGDPNGPGLPQWPAYSASDGNEVMHLGATPAAAPDGHRARYELMDTLEDRKE